jgi:hypothetical protein
MDQEKLPLSWNKALLSIIPGLLASVGLITTDFSAGMLVGSLLLIMFLLFGYWRNHRQFPGWSLMALGMLTSATVTLATGVVGGLTAIIAGKFADIIVLLFMLAALLAITGFTLKTQRLPRYFWGLSALIILCQLLVRIKYFVYFGVSWSVAGQWLSISLHAAVIGLLLPVMLGQFTAQKYGPLAILFVIGMMYGSFQILIDVNDKVSGQIGGTLWFSAYRTLIPLLFTMMAPLWFLRARSALSRIGGTLTLVSFAVVANLIIVGFSYAGELPLIIWISFMPYTLSILSALWLTYLLNRDYGFIPTESENTRSI